jgi:hypothetical protein
MTVSHTNHRFLEIFSLVTHGVIHRVIGGACCALRDVFAAAIDLIVGATGILCHGNSREGER